MEWHGRVTAPCFVGHSWQDFYRVTQDQKKPSRLGKVFKLFLLAFIALAVPMGMDQAEVNPETVRLAGRIAAGVTVLLVLYGIFTKMLKVMAFVIFVTLVLVLLVSEGQLQAPRVKNWFAAQPARN